MKFKSICSPCLIAAGFALAVFVSASAFGQSFDQTLEVSGFWTEANDLAAQCQKNWTEIEPILKKYQQALTDKKPDAVDVKEVGKTYAKAQNILRDGQILTDLGEPAGIDFSFRGNDAASLIQKARDLTKGSNDATKLMGQATAYKQKTNDKRTKTIQKLDELISKSKLEEAETELRALQSDVDTFILWLAPRDAQSVIQQYARANQVITSGLRKKRSEKTVQLVSDAILKQQLDLDALVAAANKAADEVTAKGTTTIDGSPVGGSEAFMQLCQKWEQMHGKMLNCMGMAYATDQKLEFPVKDLFGANSKSSKWTDAGYELHANLQKALLKIIEGDSQHVSAADLPQKYAQYVQAIGYLSGRLSDKTFLTACNQALEQLAKKDTAFENRVANYRRATEDILAWRSKVAQSSAKEMAKSYLPPRTIIGEQKCVPELKAGLQEAIPALTEHVGKKTSLRRVFGLTDSASFAGNNDRIWTGIKSNLTQPSKVDGLLADLYLAKNQPPLTIEAAAAMITAQNNDFEAIGGQIQSFHADGFSTRLGKLSPQMATFFPIGELPQDNADLNDMLLRVTIDPEWIQHKYFFVKLK